MSGSVAGGPQHFSLQHVLERFHNAVCASYNADACVSICRRRLSNQTPYFGCSPSIPEWEVSSGPFRLFSTRSYQRLRRQILK
jgi:hypothetical protein